MGTIVYFQEEVETPVSPLKKLKGSIEVWDNHGVPEIAVGPLDEAHSGYIVAFKDAEQLKRLIEALNLVLQRNR